MMIIRIRPIIKGPIKPATWTALDCKLEVAFPVLPDNTLLMSEFLHKK
jgi:hypothetical protein